MKPLVKKSQLDPTEINYRSNLESAFSVKESSILTTVFLSWKKWYLWGFSVRI